MQVMLCITPNPQWMDPGDETPIGYGNPINTTNEIYSGAKLHPVQGKQLHFITGDQINAILKVVAVFHFFCARISVLTHSIMFFRCQCTHKSRQGRKSCDTERFRGREGRSMAHFSKKATLHFGQVQVGDRIIRFLSLAQLFFAGPTSHLQIFHETEKPKSTATFGTHGDESANRTSNKLNKTNPLPNRNAGLSSPCPCAAIHRCGWKRTSCIGGSCGGFPCKTWSSTSSFPPSLPPSLPPSFPPSFSLPPSPRPISAFPAPAPPRCRPPRAAGPLALETVWPPVAEG